MLSKHNLRGTGDQAVLVFIDEAAFIEVETKTKVIFPTLTKDSICIAVTSRPSGSDTIGAEFMDLKYPDGRPIWRKVVLTLACTLCTARGKSSSCKHMAEKRPAWQDDENQMRTTAMMQGDTVAVDTEILNIERMDGILPLFRKEDLDKFHERPAFLGSSFTFDHVVVAIDPAAGGLSSEYAITSIGCNKYTKDRVLHKHVSVNIYIYINN